MNQDKLEEIVNVLKKISDEMDWLIWSLRAEHRRGAIRQAASMLVAKSELAGLSNGGSLQIPFSGYVAQLDKHSAERVGGTTIVVGTL